jgi:uncharacterized membrane protein YphA (DoxX/SURF4 family)
MSENDKSQDDLATAEAPALGKDSGAAPKSEPEQQKSKPEQQKSEPSSQLLSVPSVGERTSIPAGPVSLYPGGYEVLPTWKVVLLWVTCVFIGLCFLGFGASKFVGGAWKAYFDVMWGLPGYSRYVVAAVECVAGILMFIPRTRFWGSATIILLMLGGVVLLLIKGPLALSPLNLMFIMLCGIIAYAHLPAFITSRLPQRDSEPPPPIF